MCLKGCYLVENVYTDSFLERKQKKTMKERGMWLEVMCGGWRWQNTGKVWYVHL